MHLTSSARKSKAINFIQFGNFNSLLVCERIGFERGFFRDDGHDHNSFFVQASEP